MSVTAIIALAVMVTIITAQALLPQIFALLEQRNRRKHEHDGSQGP